MMNRVPHPINSVPKMGTIQWVWASALQPYQKNPMGTKGENIIIKGSRISGVASFSPFSLWSTLLLVALKIKSAKIKPSPLKVQ